MKKIEVKKMLLTVKELQKNLNIGRDKAYSLMHAKSFPSIKIGGRYYVQELALQEWLLKNRYKTIRL